MSPARLIASGSLGAGRRAPLGAGGARVQLAAAALRGGVRRRVRAGGAGAAAARVARRSGACQRATVISAIIVGSGGRALFERFRAAPEAADGARNPLDRFTRAAVGAAAGETLGAARRRAPDLLPLHRQRPRAAVPAPRPRGGDRSARAAGPADSSRARAVVGLSRADRARRRLERRRARDAARRRLRRLSRAVRGRVSGRRGSPHRLLRPRLSRAPAHGARLPPVVRRAHSLRARRRAPLQRRAARLSHGGVDARRPLVIRSRVPWPRA